MHDWPATSRTAFDSPHLHHLYSTAMTRDEFWRETFAKERSIADADERRAFLRLALLREIVLFDDSFLLDVQARSSTDERQPPKLDAAGSSPAVPTT